MMLQSSSVALLLMIFFTGFFASSLVVMATAQYDYDASMEEEAEESLTNDLVDWAGLGLPGYGASAATQACVEFVFGEPCPIKDAYHDNVIYALNLIPFVESACGDMDLFCMGAKCPTFQECMVTSNGCACQPSMISPFGSFGRPSWRDSVPPFPGGPTTGAPPSFGGACEGPGSFLPNDLELLKKTFAGTGFDVTNVTDIGQLKSMICSLKTCPPVTNPADEVCTKQPTCVVAGDATRCECTEPECKPWEKPTIPGDTIPPTGGGPTTGGPQLGGTCNGSSTQSVTAIYELMEAAGTDMGKYNSGGAVDDEAMLNDYCATKTCNPVTGQSCSSQPTCVNNDEKEKCECTSGTCTGPGDGPTTNPGGDDGTGNGGGETEGGTDNGNNSTDCVPGNDNYPACLGDVDPFGGGCQGPNFTFEKVCYQVTSKPVPGCGSSYLAPNGLGYVCAGDYTSQGLPGYIAKVAEYVNANTGQVEPYYFAVDDAAGFSHCQYFSVDTSPTGNAICIDPPLTNCIVASADGAGCLVVGVEMKAYSQCGLNLSTLDSQSKPACVIPGSSEGSVYVNPSTFVLPCVDDVCTIQASGPSSNTTSGNNEAGQGSPLNSLWDFLNQFFD